LVEHFFPDMVLLAVAPARLPAPPIGGVAVNTGDCMLRARPPPMAARTTHRSIDLRLGQPTGAIGEPQSDFRLM